MVDTQPKEVELKLAATSEAMDTLIASQLLRGHARSSLRSRQLVTTYYDTDDHRLGRRQSGAPRPPDRAQVHPDPQDRERRPGGRDRAWRMGGGAAGRHAAADRLQRSGRARPDRPDPARRAAADLRDALSPSGHAGGVARRQPAAGPDRDRVRSRRHPRRGCRGADLRDRARAQARRAPRFVRAGPVDAEAGAGAAAAARQGGAWLRIDHRPAAGVAQGARRAVAGDHDGRGRTADHPGCLRAPLDGERGRHPRCARSGRPAPDSRGTAQAALGAGLVQDGPGRPGASRLECGAALASRTVGPGTRPRRVRDRDDRAGARGRGLATRPWRCWPRSSTTPAGRPTIRCAIRWRRSATATSPSGSPVG